MRNSPKKIVSIKDGSFFCRDLQNKEKMMYVSPITGKWIIRHSLENWFEK